MEEKDSSGSGRRRRRRNPPRASDAVRKRREKLKACGMDYDDVPRDPDSLLELILDYRLSDGFDVDCSHYPYRLVKSKWGDDYDIALFARLGIHCHNFQNGTNFKFVRWEKHSTAYTSYYITLEANDPASDSDIFSFQTVLRDASYATHFFTWITLACRVKCTELVDDYWDDAAIDDFYKSAMPKWSSDEELARDNKKYYVVQESELQENDWLHLFTEVAFYVKTERALRASPSPPLEINKVVVVTKEEEYTSEILKAKNAIFYLSYKYNGVSSRGCAGDHKAVVRKTMDGKPGHMCLEVAAERTEEDVEEERREIAKFLEVMGHNS